MHFEDIKAEIRKAGSSPANIARHFGVRPTTLSLVLRGHTVSARIAKEIARVTGKKVSDLWPNKYPALLFVERSNLDSSKAAAELAALRKGAARKKAVSV
jgi:lambda repressor-like predicted transcriptional regulator